MDIVKASVIISGLSWTITYFALLYRGFRDKSYGMPFIPLALNITWEIVFSLIFPPKSMGISAEIINFIWMLCDIGIVITYFLYGYQYFKSYNITKIEWIIFSIFGFILSFLIMITGGIFFGEFEQYFHNDIFEGAKFIAFWQNLVMSISFIIMFWERETIDGQSFTIAWSKFIGTSISVGITYLRIEHRDENIQLMSVVISAIFILDVYYMYLIFQRLIKNGINPFLRL